jgi:transformation/transcription domain-associated protein
MESALDVKLKVEAAGQLRDSLDHYTTGVIYPAFLKKLIPIFITILKGQPVFISTSSEQVGNECRVFSQQRN